MGLGYSFAELSCFRAARKLSLIARKKRVG